MRAFLVLLLALFAPLAAYGQSDDFNPHRAIESLMTLDTARPLIEAHYGPITFRSTGLDNRKDGPILIMGGSSADQTPWFFLFCHNYLAGFDVPVAPAVARQLIADNKPPRSTLPMDVFGTDNGAEIWLLGENLTITYATSESGLTIAATYPAKDMWRRGFEDHCAIYAPQ